VCHENFRIFFFFRNKLSRLGRVLFLQVFFRKLLSTAIFERKLPYVTRMWANVQGDGRPAEYRRRPLFNTAKFG